MPTLTLTAKTGVAFGVVVCSIGLLCSDLRVCGETGFVPRAPGALTATPSTAGSLTVTPRVAGSLTVTPRVAGSLTLVPL